MPQVLYEHIYVSVDITDTQHIKCDVDGMFLSKIQFAMAQSIQSRYDHDDTSTRNSNM